MNDGEPDDRAGAFDPFAGANVLPGPLPAAAGGAGEVEDDALPLEQANLAEIREICHRQNRPPIIVLFGFSGSGKTTFAYRLQLLGPRDGYFFRPLVSKTGTVPSTNIVQHYWMSSTKTKQASLLIDLPGERFRRAKDLNFKGALGTDILTLIAAADAFVLFLEADKTLYSREWLALNSQGATPEVVQRLEEVTTYHRGVVNDIMAFADLDCRLQKAVFGAGNVQDGIKAHQASSVADDGKVRPSRKPAFVALSIADRLRDTLSRFPFDDPEGAATKDNFDFDPLLLVRHFENDLYRRLITCFRTFRVDFVTAFAGLAVGPGERIDDTRHDHFGVRENFAWLRRAARRERKRLRLRYASRLGMGFLTTLLDAAPSAFDASRAIAARAAWNADLRE